MNHQKHLSILAVAAAAAFFGAGCAQTSAVPAQTAPVAAPAAPSQAAPAPAATAPTNPAVQPSTAPAPTPAPAVKAPSATTRPVPKTNTTTTHRTQVVTMTKMEFSPQVLAVAVGDTVVWSNKDTVNHTSVSDNALIWDSGNLKPGASYSRTFNAPGTYTYHCGVHPSMTGSIVVYEAQK